MKIFAFVDNHGYDDVTKKLIKRIKKYNPDLILCGGDFTIFGEELSNNLEKFDKLGKKMFIVHGNHEDEKIVRNKCKKLKNIEFVHKRVVEFNKVNFVGYGGGGFSLVERGLESFIKRIQLKLKKKKVVFLTHAPVFNTKTDDIPLLGHRGSKSARNFVEKIKPKLVICGHFHENFNQLDKINKTIILNPGPLGKLIKL